ncbi:MAG TPA: methyltransferase domain-containing protein, partial [Thermoplasmatales archaeon]|nr:methyltransferase domain-containing protein [Thermoplasmatales archaeon]
MKINSKISIKTFGEVYEPADDSYMLIEAIEVNEGEKALDMGCGTGIVAIHLANAGCNVTAADIKEKALENTRENAERNGVKIRIVKSDLFSNIDGKFDIIVFNPPY